jgi:hypothetical protein
MVSSCLPSERIAEHVTLKGAFLSMKKSSAVSKGSNDGPLRWWALSLKANKTTFFERCFPNSGQFQAHHIEQLFVQGNEERLRYQAELKDGTAFRNTKYIRIEGNKIKEVDVYFGANITKKEQSNEEKARHSRS